MQEKLNLLLLAVDARLLATPQLTIAGGAQLLADDDLVLSEQQVKKLNSQWQALLDLVKRQ